MPEIRAARPVRRSPSGGAALREGVTRAIKQAMLEQLAETGYARMSMESVASRAGVGKAALYRRWRSKQAMLIDLVSEVVRAHLPAAAATGSLRGDVEAFVAETVEILRHPQVSRILPDLLAEAARDPVLADAMWTAVAGPRRAVVESVLRQAVDRGELPRDLDVDLAVDLVGAPLFFRMLVARGPVDAPYQARLTRSVLAALAAAR